VITPQSKTSVRPFAGHIPTVAGGSLVLLVTLAVIIRLSPESSAESSVMEWVRSFSAPGLGRLMESVSRFTNQPGAMLAPVATLVFLATGRIRGAVIFLVVVAMVGIAVYAADFALGEVAGRGRPVPYETRSSYPSGHTSGSTWFFVFLMFVVSRSAVTEFGKGCVMGSLGTLVVLVGLSRVFLHRHWPLDVVGGYALGILAALCAAWLFERLHQKVNAKGRLIPDEEVYRPQIGLRRLIGFKSRRKQAEP